METQFQKEFFSDMVGTKAWSIGATYKFTGTLVYIISLNRIRILLILPFSFKLMIFRFWESWARVEFRHQCCCETNVFCLPHWLFRLPKNFREACQWTTGSESGSYGYDTATYCVTIYCGMFWPTVGITDWPYGPDEFLPLPWKPKWELLVKPLIRLNDMCIFNFDWASHFIRCLRLSIWIVTRAFRLLSGKS